jgi:hypothetical protein
MVRVQLESPDVADGFRRQRLLWLRDNKAVTGPKNKILATMTLRDRDISVGCRRAAILPT